MPLPASGPRTGLLIAVTVLGTLSLHVFVPALPAAATELAATPAVIQLTITMYLVGLGFGQLFYGPLSDRFGRRPMILAALTLFVTGAAGAALATGVDGLIAARVVQALGACGGLVIGRAMVRDRSDGADATQSLARLTLAMSLAPALAPAVGAAVSVWLGWRAIFFLTAGAGAVLLGVVLALLPETNTVRGVGQGVRSMFAGYGRLLRRRTFIAYTIGGASCTVSSYAFFSASPFLIVDVLHRPAAEIGIYYLFVALGFSIGSILAHKAARRMDTRAASLAGCGISFAAALTLLVVDVSGFLNPATLVAPVVVFAIGGGLAAPNAVLGVMSADTRAVGSASSLYGCLQMSFGALCTLVVGLWHTSTALPTAIVLSVSAALGLLALLLLLPRSPAAT